MRILALDAALGACCTAILIDGVVVAERALPVGRGQAALLAPMAAAVLAQAGLRPAALDAVAATVGPGSFTGLRAALALAHGLALGAGCPVIGVTVAEALAAALPSLPGRTLWAAIDSLRAGRVFLDIGGAVHAAMLTALPMPQGAVVVVGDAAPEVAARLAARGADVMLGDARRPRAGDVARVAGLRLRGEVAMLAAQPLYGERPLARPQPVA